MSRRAATSATCNCRRGLGDLPRRSGRHQRSVKAYFALKIVGVPIDDPAMVRARECILEAGGAQGMQQLHPVLPRPPGAD